MNDASKPLTHDGRDAVLLACASLLVYVLLQQDEFINEDARVFLNNVGNGMPVSTLHPWYGPAGSAAAAALGSLGVPVYRSLSLLSALGVSVGVLFFRLSLGHTLEGRRRRNLGAALGALTPAMVFFATVIEIPGLLAGVFGVSWWLASRYARRPRWGLAVAVGVSTAVGAMVHGTGHLLPWMVAAFLWTWPHERRVPWLAASALVLGAHVAAYAGLHAAFVAPSAKTVGAAGFFEGFDAARPWFAVRAVGREWLLPFFPASVITLWLLTRPSSRRAGLGFLAVAAVYAYVSYRIIPDLWERGTYAVPVAYYAAALSARYLSLRGLALAGGLAAVVGVGLVWQHDRPHERLLPAEVLLELSREQRTLIVVGDVFESDDALRKAPDLPIMRVWQFVASPLPDDQLCAGFDVIYGGLVANGTRVCFTEWAWTLLSDHREGLREHIETRYRRSPVSAPGLVAFEVLRRS